MLFSEHRCWLPGVLWFLLFCSSVQLFWWHLIPHCRRGSSKKSRNPMCENRSWYYHYWQTIGIQQWSQFGHRKSELGQLSCFGEVRAVYSFLSCASADLIQKNFCGPFFTTDQKPTLGRGRRQNRNICLPAEHPKIMNQLPFPSFPIDYVELKMKVF